MEYYYFGVDTITIKSSGTEARPTKAGKARQELGKTRSVPKQELGNENDNLRAIHGLGCKAYY